MKNKKFGDIEITKEWLDEQAYKKIEKERKEKIKRNKSFK
jgi:hypothetical protein